MTDTIAIILLLMLPIGLLGLVVGIWAGRPTVSSPGWNWKWGYLIPCAVAASASAFFWGFLIWALNTQLD